MTHEELLKQIDDIEYPWCMQDALRAVVELHNCSNKYCGNCGMPSPCFTIKAIQLNLQ